MIRRLLALVFVSALFSAHAFAQDPTITATLSSTTCPGTGCVQLSALSNRSMATVEVSGTWTGALSAKITSSGASVTVFEASSKAPLNSISTNGVYQVPMGGASLIRIQATEMESGAAVVKISAGQGSADFTLPNGAASEATATAANGVLVTIANGQITGNASLNLIESRTPALGQAAMAASSPVVIASNQSAVPVSGTVTANAGTGTFAVSAASLPLPTGAAAEATLSLLNGKVTAVDTGAVVVASSALPAGASTSAKQPALGTAGASSADVLTVQGRAAMTPLLVDGSGATQPVSAAALPLPAGASTSALQTSGNSSLSSIDAKTPALGQALSGASVPVVLPAAQITSLTPPAAITGFALDATLTGGTQKTKIVDSGGTNAASVSAGGAVKVDGSAVTQPVSGTFFQATQPVSATQLPAALAANGGMKVEGVAGGVAVPTSLATLPALTAGSAVIGHVITDTGSLVQISNGSGNTAAVKGAVAPASITDEAVVVALSPNSPLPIGNNSIGHVIADSGSTTAVTGNVTAVQSTGSNLHAVIDSGTVSVGTVPTTYADAGQATSSLVLSGLGNTVNVILAQNQLANLGSVTFRFSIGAMVGSASILFEASFDSGSNYTQVPWTLIKGSGGLLTYSGTTFPVAAYSMSSSQTDIVSVNLPAGTTNLRARVSSAASAGTAAVQYVANASRYAINAARILGASAVAAAADLAEVVALSPNSPLPAGTNTLGAVRVTDGTNLAAVKQGSVAAQATDASLVVSLSPNNPVKIVGAGSATWAIDGNGIGPVSADATTPSQNARVYSSTSTQNLVFGVSNVATCNAGGVGAFYNQGCIFLISGTYGAGAVTFQSNAQDRLAYRMDTAPGWATTFSLSANEPATFYFPTPNTGDVPQMVTSFTSGTQTVKTYSALPPMIPTSAAGNGTADASTNRVTLASNSTGNIATIGTSVTPGTGATNLGKAEDATHTSGDVGVMAMGIRKDTNAQTTNADGDYTPGSFDAYGAQFTRVDHPNRIRCTVTVSTATTIQAVGTSCAAPGAGLSIYITDIEFSSSAAGIAADAFPTLKYGTGGTCGTGTTVFWGALSAAAVRAEKSYATPIKIPANNEVCWITSTAGSKFLVLTGYIAP